MNKEQFNELSYKDKRKYIKKRYPELCKEHDEQEMMKGTYYCKGCEETNYMLQHHHIVFKSQGDLWLQIEPKNIILLCQDCHIPKAHDTIERQKELKCYEEMKEIKELLLTLK